MLFADVTDLSRREAEERFAAGLAQLGELSAGVAHELRNSLATVQGYLGARGAAGAAAGGARGDRRGAPRGGGARTHRGRLPDLRAARLGRPRTGRSRRPSGAGGERPGARRGRGRARRPRTLRADDRRRSASAAARLAQSPAQRRAGDPRPCGRRREPASPAAAQAPIVIVALPRRRALARATITIDDRGGGLAPEIRDRLFEPFASGRAGGAGLGLALARRIVVMHGGSLALLPREPHGVRAEIRLPLGDSDTKGSGPRPTVPARPGEPSQTLETIDLHTPQPDPPTWYRGCFTSPSTSEGDPHAPAAERLDQSCPPSPLDARPASRSSRG